MCKNCTTYSARPGVTRPESPDYADGGVTAALIEKEAEKHNPAHDIDWQEGAEREEESHAVTLRERDEANARAKGYAATIDEQRALIETLRAAEFRPLSPDAITDEMVERALNTYRDVRSQQGYVLTNNDKTQEAMSHALRAALTEPPARPEGAEEIEAWLDGMPESIRLDGDEHQRLFANHLAHMGFRVPVTLAERGVRVVGEDGAA